MQAVGEALARTAILKLRVLRLPPIRVVTFPTRLPLAACRATVFGATLDLLTSPPVPPVLAPHIAEVLRQPAKSPGRQ